MTALEVLFTNSRRSPDGVVRKIQSWPEGWPPPRPGDEIQSEDGHLMVVQGVTWYPYGEHDSNDKSPFVWVRLVPAPS